MLRVNENSPLGIGGEVPYWSTISLTYKLKTEELILFFSFYSSLTGY
jgi:hypothetical protein